MLTVGTTRISAGKHKFILPRGVGGSGWYGCPGLIRTHSLVDFLKQLIYVFFSFFSPHTE